VGFFLFKPFVNVIDDGISTKAHGLVEALEGGGGRGALKKLFNNKKDGRLKIW